jgi:FtsP/CotA-like multicopper oxidase with cupredoxin domain
MSSRGTFWLAAAALFLSAVALPVALVAALRAGEEAAPAMDHSTMQLDEAMTTHMAPAPMEGVPNATARRGGLILKPRVQGGVWTFDLTARPVRWEIVEGTRVTAWTYNGTVPGPELRVPYGQRLRIRFKNELPEATTVHWHGIAVPNAMDGVPDVTQTAIEPGGSFTYAFRAIPAGRNSNGGTFFYHSHQDEDRQLGLGLSGPLVIDSPTRERYEVERTVMIAEWNFDLATGETRPAMDADGMLPNFFTLNGKSFPATETIPVRRGDRVLLRLIGAGQFSHPMHLHGTDFRVIAKDGHRLASPYDADVLQVGSGERYDVAFRATEPGKWIFHCHIGHHATNNGNSPGGLMLVVDVAR